LILRLKRQHVNLLEEEARKVHPIEACAILFGRLTQKEAVVKRIVVTPNRLQSTVGFEVDPEKFADAFAKADDEGLDFIGLFHSHPAQAKPSLIDRRYMKLWGNAIWLILSSTNGSLSAYQMKDDKVKEVAFRVE
jgi:proteasome lid subunit RPN8/RPN11